jgi:hypothetical protein
MRQVQRSRRADTGQCDLAHGPVEAHPQRRSGRHARPAHRDACARRHELQPRGLGAPGKPADPAGPAEDGLRHETRPGHHAAHRPERAVVPQFDRDRRPVCIPDGNAHELACKTRPLHLRQSHSVDTEPAARPGEKDERECCHEDQRHAAQRQRPPPPRARGSPGDEHRPRAGRRGRRRDPHSRSVPGPPLAGHRSDSCIHAKAALLSGHGQDRGLPVRPGARRR